jgi:hypothetical protein
MNSAGVKRRKARPRPTVCHSGKGLRFDRPTASNLMGRYQCV